MGRATPKAKARTKSATDTSRDEPKSPKPVSAKLRARDTTRNPTMAGMTRVKKSFFNLVCIDTPHRPVPQETGKRAATARFPPPHLLLSIGYHYLPISITTNQMPHPVPKAYRHSC